MEEAHDRIGRVSTAAGQEASNSVFYVWIDDQQLIEATQLVYVSVPIPDPVRHRLELQETETVLHAIVDVVFRRSSSQSVLHDRTRFGGDGNATPPMLARGVSYAECRVIARNPPILTVPIEDTPVYLSGQDELGQAYSYDTMIESGQDYRLAVGFVKNGGLRTAGPAYIDTRYLLGENAGHVNVTGVAGQGTKSSYLLWLIKSLLVKAQQTNNGDPHILPLVVRPIVFNVKGEDLMFIDFGHQEFGDDKRRQWQGLGLSDYASPFTGAVFLSPSLPRQRTASLVL